MLCLYVMYGKYVFYVGYVCMFSMHVGFVCMVCMCAMYVCMLCTYVLYVCLRKYVFVTCVCMIVIEVM